MPSTRTVGHPPRQLEPRWPARSDPRNGSGAVRSRRLRQKSRRAGIRLDGPPSPTRVGLPTAQRVEKSPGRTHDLQSVSVRASCRANVSALPHSFDHVVELLAGEDPEREGAAILADDWDNVYKSATGPGTAAPSSTLQRVFVPDAAAPDVSAFGAGKAGPASGERVAAQLGQQPSGPDERARGARRDLHRRRHARLRSAGSATESGGAECRLAGMVYTAGGRQQGGQHPGAEDATMPRLPVAAVAVVLHSR